MEVHYGWDIGGVNLKLSRLSHDGTGGAAIDTRIVPFEIWRELNSLEFRLRSLIESVERETGLPPSSPRRHGVTMTAEISDAFPDRSAGVRAILGACAGAIGSRDILVLNLEGKLVPLEQALERPLSVAAANWVATSQLAARWWAARGDRRAALLIDVGSTTTDIIPLREGRPDPVARTDADRLISGELVYSGLLRTPPNNFADVVPVRGSWCRLAAEHFAIAADIHRVLDRIADDEYIVPTPDGRGKGKEDAEARLARLICSDRESLGSEVIRGIASHLADRQVDQIAAALRQVISRKAEDGVATAIVAGAGRTLGDEAARRAGLDAVPLATLCSEIRGEAWDRSAASAADALLLTGALVGSAPSLRGGD